MLQCEHCGLQHEESLVVCPETGKLFRPERIFPFGTQLEGKYLLESVLGSGGMGAVFRAKHTLLNKTVAIKLTLPAFAKDEQMMARMVREARAASSTGHRNVAAVTDMGWSDQGGLFIVMEYLAGETMHHLVGREGPLPPWRAVSLVSQVLAGLAAVHAKGVIHRDLKPENVMIVKDEDGAELAKILDFGISKIVNDDRGLELTQTGLVMGSPRYMSPEQARGVKDVDQRVDIYAAGGILYTLLVGQPPLTADNYHAMLAAILDGNITPPSRRVAGLPSALDRVVLRAMARERSERYADAGSFRAALQPFCEAPTGAPSTDRRVGVQSSAVGDAAEWSADALVPLDELSPARSGRPIAAIDTADLARATDKGPARPAERGAPRPARAQPGASVSASGPRKGPVDEPLELDLDPMWQRRSSSAAAREQGGQLPARSDLQQMLRPELSLGALARKGGIALVLLLAAGALWMFRQPLWSMLAGGGPSAAHTESIMVLLETEPSDADVYVDGVLQLTKPIELPRSDRLFNVRVQARGYRSRRLQVRGDRTQTIQVQLRRSR